MPTPKLKAFAGDSRGRKIPSAGHTRYAQHPQQRTSSTSRPVAEAFSFRRQRSGRGDQGHLQRRQTGIPEETPSLQAGPFPESRKARAVTRASAPDSDRHRAQAAGRVTVAPSVMPPTAAVAVGFKVRTHMETERPWRQMQRQEQYFGSSEAL